jgi:hypothetical protein
MTDTERLWIIIALVSAATLFAVVLYTRHQSKVRRQQLRRQFGPEYDRTVEELGSAARADHELARRARRVQHFRFKELSAADRSRFAASWQQIQAQFVDDPAVAVNLANELINEVMRARGYPTRDFEQRVADLSVEHPTVIQHYRAAHELAHSTHGGALDTEQLRQAVVHYRKLFAELLDEGKPAAGQVHGGHRQPHPSYS